MAQGSLEKRPARVVVAVVVTLIASVSLALVSWIPGYRSLFRGLPEIAWWIENAIRPLIPVGLGLWFVYGARPARWPRELGMNRPVGKSLLLALLQLAALTGAWGIIFLMTWTASVANTWWESDFRIRPIATLLVAYGAAMVATFGFGEVRLRYTETPEQTIRVAGITASESQRQRQFDVFGPVLLEGQPLTAEVAVQSGQSGMEVAAELLSESERQAEAGAELLVWSEAAIVIRAEEEPALLEMAGDVAAKHGVLLGITPLVLEPEAPSLFAERKPYNRIKLVLIDRNGKVAWQVSKTKLVVPIESTSSVAGDGQFPVVETGVGPVAGAICFDLDHPSMIRRSRFGAPRIFLAPSNDWEAITARGWVTGLPIWGCS